MWKHAIFFILLSFKLMDCLHVCEIIITMLKLLKQSDVATMLVLLLSTTIVQSMNHTSDLVQGP